MLDFTVHCAFIFKVGQGEEITKGFQSQFRSIIEICGIKQKNTVSGLKQNKTFQLSTTVFSYCESCYALGL